MPSPSTNLQAFRSIPLVVSSGEVEKASRKLSVLRDHPPFQPLHNALVCQLQVEGKQLLLCRFGVKNCRLQALQASFLQREGQQGFIIKAQAIYFFHCAAPFLKHYGHILVKRFCDLDHQVKDAIVVHSIEELLEELKKYDEENIYIIGGESIYRQMLPYCDVAHVTKIDHAYEADAYFPDLDSDPEWEITADSDEQVYFDITYQFLKYERKKA